MLVISRFYGIVIKMYFLASEHKPPHIHVFYGGYSASIVIADGSLLDGHLPRKTISMIREWLSIHRDEVQKMWDTQDFKSIPGLE